MWKPKACKIGVDVTEVRQQAPKTISSLVITAETQYSLVLSGVQSPLSSGEEINFFIGLTLCFSKPGLGDSGNQLGGMGNVKSPPSIWWFGPNPELPINRFHHLELGVI